MLLYIHGFGSSGQGEKVSLLRQKLGKKVLAPSLSPIPDLAVDTLDQIISFAIGCGVRPGLVGSSLGGYYATYFADKYALKAVLINPSVRPYETLASHIGLNHSFFDFSNYEFTQKHIDSLKKYAVKKPDTKHFMVLLQTGDEVLDFRQAAAKFAGARIDIEEGGSHGYEGFGRKIPDIVAFLGI